MKKSIFLDRDGVINKKLEGDYVKTLEEFEILPGVKEALKEFKNLGYLIIVVTNQQGIGKGLMTEEDLKKIHEYMVKELEYIDDIFYCPHLEGTCDCRKPRPGMLLKAQEKWNIDFSKSWMIGDSDSDILCGKSVGCKTIKIGEDKNKLADFCCNSLIDCVEIIKNFEKLK